ncbi:MAG TPA: M48 family metalloprotease, partial [Iamia sp.]|nr:M48 family metalloprotease [Iamia sp.]
MDDALARNEAIARRLATVPAAIIQGVLTLVGVVVLIALGLPLVALLGVLVSIVSFLGLTRAIRQQALTAALAAVPGRAVTEADEPRLHNAVEGLCVGIGLAPPRLHVVEDDAANALAVARSVDDADLVVTRGLLDRLSLVELEAVLAHELARIRRGDAVVGPLAGVALGGPGAAAPVSIVAPITRAVVGRGEPVETWSDLAAVDITRYPPALASALATLASVQPAVPGAARPAAAHLWVHGARADGP